MSNEFEPDSILLGDYWILDCELVNRKFSRWNVFKLGFILTSFLCKKILFLVILVIGELFYTFNEYKSVF